VAEEPWAQLGDAISAIRAQLQQAEDDGRDQTLKFRTGPVELEFTVQVKAEGKGKAKVFVLPWTAEAEAGASRDRLHRIKMTLHPVDEHGQDKKIADQSEQRPK
jgi:NTP-dependent ternary system trypsin peptidase co-occuring protein